MNMFNLKLVLKANDYNKKNENTLQTYPNSQSLSF